MYTPNSSAFSPVIGKSKINQEAIEQQKKLGTREKQRKPTNLQ